MNLLMFVPGDYFGGCEDYAFRIAESAVLRGWTVTLVFSSDSVLKKARERLSSLKLYMLKCPFGPEFNKPRSM